MSLGVGTLVVCTLPEGIARARRWQGAEAKRPEMQRLRWSMVALTAVVIATVVVAAGTWLSGLAAQAQDPAKARIDVVRTAMTLGAGLVGMVLWLTGRKKLPRDATGRTPREVASNPRGSPRLTPAWLAPGTVSAAARSVRIRVVSVSGSSVAPD